MGILGGILNVLLLITSVFLICLVLIQRGKGGGLAGAFGGMGGSSAFGTKAGDVFTKITVVTAAVWFLLAMLLVVLSNQGRNSAAAGLGSAPVALGTDAAGTGVDSKGATVPIAPPAAPISPSSPEGIETSAPAGATSQPVAVPVEPEAAAPKTAETPGAP